MYAYIIIVVKLPQQYVNLFFCIFFSVHFFYSNCLSFNKLSILFSFNISKKMSARNCVVKDCKAARFSRMGIYSIKVYLTNLFIFNINSSFFPICKYYIQRDFKRILCNGKY